MINMTNEHFMETPVGYLKIAEQDGCIVGVDYTDDVSAGNASNEILDQCVRELREYFAGDRQRFDIPLNLSHRGTPFQQKVWKRLYEIPYGETISYKMLAEDCGGPTYSRAVANANGKNPVSIIVPCHRVIAHDGSLGGYTGGVEKKERLLDLERR